MQRLLQQGLVWLVDDGVMLLYWITMEVGDGQLTGGKSLASVHSSGCQVPVHNRVGAQVPPLYQVYFAAHHPVGLVTRTHKQSKQRSMHVIVSEIFARSGLEIYLTCLYNT